MNLTERIESVILSNLQPADRRKIGIECECFFYDKDFKRIPVNPGNQFSAIDFLNEMNQRQENDDIKTGYSLEPGGQLEWASPPLLNLHELQMSFSRHLKRVMDICKEQNIYRLDYSLEPLYTPNEIKLIDNEKYRLMHKMFTKTGELGPWMMRNTTSIQLNIDFSSKEEAERMAFIADCLEPIAAILFANSPFWGGNPAGETNLRYKIWDDTDAARCNNLLDHGISKADGLVHNYAKYIQAVPAIFIKDEKNNIAEYDGTLGEWLSNLEAQEQLTDAHIQIALHQIFTHVRFKNVLEVRGCDRPPGGYEFAPAAFWIGILLDNKTQEEVFELVREWSTEDRKQLNRSATKLNLKQSGPSNITLGKWLDIFCEYSLSGLNRRKDTHSLKNEAHFLQKYLDAFKRYGIPTLEIQKKQQKSGKTVSDFIRDKLIK